MEKHQLFSILLIVSGGNRYNHSLSQEAKDKGLYQFHNYLYQNNSKNKKT